MISLIVSLAAVALCVIVPWLLWRITR